MPPESFDQMRRKQHRLVYDIVGLDSRQEIERSLAFAKAFVEEVRGQIKDDS